MLKSNNAMTKGVIIFLSLNIKAPKPNPTIPTSGLDNNTNDNNSPAKKLCHNLFLINK